MASVEPTAAIPNVEPRWVGDFYEREAQAAELFRRFRRHMLARRRAGLEFEEAWSQCLASVPIKRGRLSGQEVRPALEATKEGWRRAYERVPPSTGERALDELIPPLGDADWPPFASSRSR